MTVRRNLVARKGRLKVHVSLLCALLLLTACGNDEADPGSEEPEDTPQAAAENPETDEQEIDEADECETVAARASTHEPPENNPNYDGLVLFAEELEERTEGRVTLEIFESGQLGGLAENAELVRTGSVEVTLADPGTLSNFWPELALTQYPFFFESTAQTDEMMDGAGGEFIAQRLAEEANIIPLYGRSAGARQMFFVEGSGPVTSPDDLVGISLRVPDNPPFPEMAETLGATPVVVDATELYSALETGIVDGFEFPVIPAVGLSLHEPVTHMSLTSHIVAFNWIVGSADFVEGLCDADREALHEAAAEAQDLVRGLYAAEAAEFDAIVSEALEVVEVDADAFRETLAPMFDTFVDEHGSELLDVLVAEHGIQVGG